MRSRRTIVGQQIIYLPELCAWCGERRGKYLRDVRLTHRHLWVQVHYSLLLPICPSCSDYLEVLRVAERRLEIVLTLFAVPLAAVFMNGLLSIVGSEGDWLMFGVGTALFAVVLTAGVRALMTRTGLKTQLLHRWTAKAPPGYAADFDAPGEIVDDMKFRFHSADFHREFSELNPESVRSA
ncbi:MAG: hypothetical protein ACP5JG_18960 [Anaerolineae bacterium]